MTDIVSNALTLSKTIRANKKERTLAAGAWLRPRQIVDCSMHPSCPSLGRLACAHRGFVSHELFDLGELALVGARSDPQLEIEQQEHGALQSQTLMNEQTRRDIAA